MREDLLEIQLDCALNEVKRLKEKNYVMKISLDETKRENELLKEYHDQKYTKISHLKRKKVEMRKEN